MNCVSRSHFTVLLIELCAKKLFYSKLLIELWAKKFIHSKVFESCTVVCVLAVSTHESFYYTCVTNIRFNIQLVLTAFTLIFMLINLRNALIHKADWKTVHSQHSTKITMKLQPWNIFITTYKKHKRCNNITSIVLIFTLPSAYNHNHNIRL